MSTSSLPPCATPCKSLGVRQPKFNKQGAIQSTIERNPTAFVSKFEKRAGGKRSHNAGCNCKKSACLKKYCECFQAGVACAANCKCSNCKNYEGAAGGRKRRAPEPSAATIVQQTPRTPPRTSSRNRGAEVVSKGLGNEEVFAQSVRLHLRFVLVSSCVHVLV